VQLYKYNGNLLHLCTFASLNVSPATEISAGGKFWSACGNGKSAGEKSFCQPVEEVVRRQKEKGCYSICATRTLHITSVTSEPKLLQNVPYIIQMGIIVLLARDYNHWVGVWPTPLTTPDVSINRELYS